MRNLMPFAAICAAVTLAAAAAPGAAPGAYPAAALRAQSKLARDALMHHFSDIERRSHLAVALEERLDGDASQADVSNRPAWMTLADYEDDSRVLFDLNASLVLQLASGKYHELGAIRGADDTVYRSPADGTLQPLAVYVPAAYDARKPTMLVVFLHGRTWSENDVIATPTVRQIADETGTIVIAPYGRGDSQYMDPASADVYAALEVAEKAFNVDRRRVYLAGHSMGGYGVFIVGPRKPELWAAMLAASGGMTSETVDSALHALRKTPVYLVVGSDDPIVPQGYMAHNAQLLHDSGIEAHLYEQPGGLHSIVTIATAFKRAWRDMLAHRSGAVDLKPGTNPIPRPSTPAGKPT
ncbi:MAG: alpha/beta fold hydrolase [Candidatus Eremiobacteraeota bacterium]|nr:alpha/beta fold hydrolase [Candidatus Eremiobacteraeota bacterium]